jgi:hypothetical protein
VITWENVALGALGVGTLVAAGFFPALAAYLVPAGVGLIGLATPTPKTSKAP